MGLSRKLGNVATQRSMLTEYLSVEYKWSTQSYTIQDIMDKFKLPCVVQCATDQCSISWSKFQFDLRYPLLLYSRQTVKKVQASNLTMSTLEEFGPSVVIPEDYEGWFGATPKGVNQTKRHTRIEGIAHSNTLRFLVTTKCPAYTRSSGLDGSLEYVPRDIIPGEIFKRVCIMDGDIDDPDTPDIIQMYGPCLECLDEKDDDVVIPLSRRAIAYEISEFYPDSNHKVFNVKSMISAGNSKLPRIVSLVHGERPILDYAFTGLLRCYTVFTEETVLAATLDETAPVCLELTTDSTARFKLSLNEASIKRTCEYNNAFQLCKASGDSFLMGLKVSFSVQPEPETDENMSTYEIQSTVSDMQEVEANSEFEIAWSSEQNTSSSKSSNKIKAIEKGTASMTDNFTLVSNDSSKLPMNKIEVKSESRHGHSVPDLAFEDDSNPPVDFTEKEIADLMVRKGMIQGLGTSSSSDLNLIEEIETLRKSKVKQNPIYYCNEPELEMNRDQGSGPEQVYSEIDDLAVNDETDNENCDIVELSLDESEFGEAVYTRANEYHGDSEDEDSGEEPIDEVTNGADEEDSFSDDYVVVEEIKELSIDVPDIDKDGNSSHNEAVIKPNEKDVDTMIETCELEVDAVGKADELDEYAVIKEDALDVDPEIKSDELDVKSVIKSDKANVQTVRHAASSDIPQASGSVEFLHGLNVMNKSTSSDMMNKKKWWSSKRKGEGGSILNKFKSESNISKIFGRLKGSDDEDSISSSKTKLLQLKPSVKSSPKSATQNGIKNEDDENLRVIEC